MADLTAYTYPDGSEADQLRYLKQVYAEAMQAKSVSTGSKTVVRQDLNELRKAIEVLEDKTARSDRMHTVYTVHARR
jgi:hypothetical protein